MIQWLSKAAYSNNRAIKLLLPLSLLFGFLGSIRRSLYRSGIFKTTHCSAVVIVIGNITAGGTGKTPLTLALAQHFTNEGLRVAIISRGYGGKSKHYPLAVTLNTSARECGDEALLYVRGANCPVVVDPLRSRAVEFLQNTEKPPQVILSDDGLQHYALGRDLEIAVLDGKRGTGNGLLLPAGPLREPVSRLNSVDFLISNGQWLARVPALKSMDKELFNMQVEPIELENVATGERLSTAEFKARYSASKQVHALAGIGNPERFFNTLTQCGFGIITHVLPDHHVYNSDDLQFDEALPVIMTEKDAVKCQSFATAGHWCLLVAAVLPDAFTRALDARVEHALNKKQGKTLPS